MISKNIGASIYGLISSLYPINRSLTGPGVTQTLEILKKHIPIYIHSIPTGNKVLDWTVPQEWTITDAWIKNSKGEKVVDFKENNLHIVGYSTPFNGKLSLTQLKKRLHTLPEKPDWIPYKTSYYKKTWGFCLTQKVYDRLTEDIYEVCIDSTLTKGSLKYAELIIPGESEKEIIISSHICHPSLANDNLSSVAVSVFLAKYLLKRKNKYTYRFIFAPGTIGAIVWLNKNQKEIKNILGGIVLAGIGDKGAPTYKKTLSGNSVIDYAFEKVLSERNKKHSIINYFPYGYDERQYNSPGFNLPVGCFMRTPWGEYPEYHTSADNLKFISQASLEDSYAIILDALEEFDTQIFYKNMHPFAEPLLSRHGYYESIPSSLHMACLWTLALSEGRTPLSLVSLRSGIEIEKIEKSAQLL